MYSSSTSMDKFAMFFTCKNKFRSVFRNLPISLGMALYVDMIRGPRWVHAASVSRDSISTLVRGYPYQYQGDLRGNLPKYFRQNGGWPVLGNQATSHSFSKRFKSTSQGT